MDGTGEQPKILLVNARKRSSHPEQEFRFLEHAGENNIIDAVLVNDKFPENALEKYKEAHQEPVEIDDDEINDILADLGLDDL